MQPQSSFPQVPGGVEGGQAPALPTVPMSGQPMPQSIQTSQASAPAAAPVPAPAPSAPAMADDGDLIEKEWVAKVKQVVNGTAHDPYELNRQFTKLKADYMQKRYGKSIKLDE
ncbi:MAG TPA: hypothetical protein VGE30_02840 [Candidatus Saccharimonadales bacterium]